MTVKLTAGQTIQVEDVDGNVFEGKLQVPDLDKKDFENIKTTLIKVKPDVVQRRELADFFTTEVDNSQMMSIDSKVIPLYEALRSISVQRNIDRDQKAREEIYKFLNAIREDMVTLSANKED